MPAVRPALGHEGQHVALARGQLFERVAYTPRPHELLDERGVDDGTTGVDPLERVRELVDVSDPRLQHVADAAASAEQLHRVLDLDVRGQDEDRDLRQLLADRPRRLEPFGRMGRRHADVDDRDVRLLLPHELDQALGVARLTDDVVAPLAQQRGEALPKQHVVVGDRRPAVRAPLPAYSGVYAVRASIAQPAARVYRLAGTRIYRISSHNSAAIRLARERRRRRSSVCDDPPAPDTPLTCLIVDDSPQFFEAARQLLADDAITVVGVAATSEQAVNSLGAATRRRAGRHRPRRGERLRRRATACRASRGGPPVVLISAESAASSQSSWTRAARSASSRRPTSPGTRSESSSLTPVPRASAHASDRNTSVDRGTACRTRLAARSKDGGARRLRRPCRPRREILAAGRSPRRGSARGPDARARARRLDPRGGAGRSGRHRRRATRRLCAAGHRRPRSESHRDLSPVSLASSRSHRTLFGSCFGTCWRTRLRRVRSEFTSRLSLVGISVCSSSTTTVSGSPRPTATPRELSWGCAYAVAWSNGAAACSSSGREPSAGHAQ